jgi:dynein heavy chain
MSGIKHTDARLNPKAIRAQEMYGEVDPLSGEWTTGTIGSHSTCTFGQHNLIILP